MLRIVAVVLCMIIAAPAYAARTVEVDPLLGINLEVLPPICQSALVLPVMNFAYWLNREQEVFSGLNLENLRHTVVFGVEPAVHACLWQMNQRLQYIHGGP